MSIPGQIGPFQIEAEIGRGGMGVVYRARDERLERMVAIKAIIPGVAADPARMGRLRREARTVAQLNHPHIAQIHQILEHGGQSYLVLEYVPGESLAEHIQAKATDGGIEAADALALMLQIARALEAAHSRGIVHRDLKPHNIRITPDGTAKVLDFGIAMMPLRGSPAGDEPTLSLAPSDRMGIIGTPGYMAPEQCRGEEVDARADVFAFGCVLYECLTGRKAFEGRTHADLLAATLRSDPDFGRLNDSTPAAVRALVRQCLVREKSRRLASMTDVRVVLEQATAPAAAPHAAGPRTLAPAVEAPGNLPHPRDRFIGRTKELAELTPLLQENRLLTLMGAGGCGKTRLALELARRVQEHFPDGVWLAELAATSEPSQVPHALARAMGVTEEANRSMTQALCKRLDGKKSLLILDNCEHVLSAAGKLADALLDATGDLRIIATSREGLGIPGEQPWRVPSLTLPPAQRAGSAGDSPTPASSSSGSKTSSGGTSGSGAGLDALLSSEAVALFLDRAKVLKPSLELTETSGPAVARICRRLDGIPLAIELAAARVKVLSVEQIEKRLDERFRLLTGGKASAERHQTLRATVDWSYRLLSREEQSALRHLSVFAGGWTLEGATAVAGGPGADEFEVLDLLTHLADKSLVLVDDVREAEGGARYRLLETVRQYAAEKLADADETVTARNRHLAFYHAMAEQALLEGPEQAGWFDRLDTELENLLEAVRWGSSDLASPEQESQTAEKPASDQDELTPLTRALRTGGRLGRFWDARGHYLLARQAIAQALRSERPADPLARASALHVAGTLAMERGDLDEARKLLEQGLAIFRDSNFERGIAAAMGNLGITAFERGDLATAQELLEQVLPMVRQLRPPLGAALTLANLGFVAHQRRELEKAIQLHEEGLALAREAEHRYAMSQISGMLGTARRDLGELAEARRCLGQSMQLSAEIGFKLGLVMSFSRAATVAVLCGEPQIAATLAGAAASQHEQIGGAFIPFGIQKSLEKHLGAARAELRERTGSDEAWRGAEEEGRAMTADQAVAWALQWLLGEPHQQPAEHS